MRTAASRRAAQSDRAATVELLGGQVGLVNAARVDASGQSGGGTVLVGGDYQGNNAAVQNATRTYVGADATIVADAGQDGDGGKVIVWSDDATQMYGEISARGGSNGGNGGFVEASGKRWLDFQGQADLRAANGSAGTLLLDPTDITISGAANTPTSAFGSGAFTNPTTTPSNLNVATLTAQLALGNVTVSTASGLAGSGDITVNNAISYASANSLTLSANRSIAVVAGSGGISNTGGGAITLTGGGTGSIALNEGITSGGGAIALASGTGGVTLAAAKSIDAGAGTIAINAGGGAANLTHWQPADQQRDRVRGQHHERDDTGARQRRAHGRRDAVGQPQRRGLAVRRNLHQRHGWPDQGRRRRAHLVTGQHLHRDHDGQCRHAGGVRWQRHRRYGRRGARQRGGRRAQPHGQ